MEDHVEEYLKILEPLIKDESVNEIQWLEDADNISSINTQTEIKVTYQNTDAWYLPSRSYLIIEGNISSTTPPSATTRNKYSYPRNCRPSSIPSRYSIR